jgi:hypothetical protein
LLTLIDYVPFTMWRDTEPSLASVLHISRQSFKHELLLDNVVGIPILQQHGSDDDNVPAYHSRLMHQLTWETEWLSEYHELPHHGHWFNGVLTTPPLREFYFYHALGEQRRNLLPAEYSMIIPTSGDMGSRGGIAVDQLQNPDRFGHIRVVRDTTQQIWHLKTRNIHRFHLLPAGMRAAYPAMVFVDDSTTPFDVPIAEADSTWFVQTATGLWVCSRDPSWQSLSERYGRQNGAMDALLRSTGRFIVKLCSPGSSEVALQISRNLFQYFAADCQIVTECAGPYTALSLPTDNTTGNVITVAVGKDLPPSLLSTFPIRLEENHLGLQLVHQNTRSDRCDGGAGAHSSGYAFQPALGAVFLRPLQAERLELVVWGFDLNGLEQAARLVPALTGAGQPDFVVLGPQCRWKGHGGVYAAGFFDWSWQISSGSYIS